MPRNYRGSQKHVLDLLDSGGNGLATLNSLFHNFNVNIAPTDTVRPSGRVAPKEFYLPQFCTEFCQGRFNFTPLVNWWVPSPWRPPTWDLISTCEVNGKFGIVLVEAKAHENEFDWGGKSLKPHPSLGSKRNHSQISGCIREVQMALQPAFDGQFGLSIDSHYQLTNRVAHLWKLATCGIPVVLVYLGFVGDSGIEASYFRNDEHWQRAMGGYAQGVVPHLFFNSFHSVANQGSMLMLSRSLAVQSVSVASPQSDETLNSSEE